MPWNSQADWAGLEAAAVEKTRAEFAEQRKEEEHANECQAYAAFARQRAEKARKRGNRGDDLIAQTWTDEAERIARGECTSNRVIRSDFEANSRFGSLRTRLAYAGKMFAANE